MRDKNRVNKVVLKKMIEYCSDIEENFNKFENPSEKYLADKFFRYACDMCILQIGEFTTRLSEDFKEENSEIEWRKIKGLRNIHVHEYEKVNFDYMLETLTKDIPELKEKLQEILEKTD